MSTALNRAIRNQEMMNHHLECAIRQNNRSEMRQFIERGADVNMKFEGYSALQHCLHDYQYEGALVLLEEGAVYNAREMATYIYEDMTEHDYLDEGELALLEHLVHFGWNIDYVYADGNTFLHAAVGNCDPRITRRILNFGADATVLNSVEKNAMTLLYEFRDGNPREGNWDEDEYGESLDLLRELQTQCGVFSTDFMPPKEIMDEKGHEILHKRCDVFREELAWRAA